MSIEDTLKERGSRYGSFSEQAKVSYGIKDAMRDSKNWDILEPYQKESFDMLANKLARILNGDPKYDDNYHDAIGYLTLIQNELGKEANAPN